MAVELLAPAGSWEAMEAAVGAGADAVYVGGKAFGARAFAANFSGEDLCRAVDYVHLRRRRLYLAVNTLLKNQEIEKELDGYLLPLYRQGLDAVIVQDMGVFAYIRQRFPDLPVHVSTQMAVTGVSGAAMLEREGAARVVYARELLLSELKHIRQNTSLEMEVFVHGALCYCYSGQCLFSSMLGGRSGNRGRCAQPCRLPYQVGKEKSRLLSLKDLCALELLPQLVEAGVDSLKIEGRMKQPEYVAGVVSVYRRYLDGCLEGRRAGQWDGKQLKKDKEFLRDLFHRGGFSQGYLIENPGPSMIAFENHKKTGSQQAEIRKRKEKIKGNLILSSDSRAILELSADDCHTINVTGDIPQKAKSQPASRERIVEQMRKTGNEPFDFGEFQLQMEEELFVPVSQLNDLRRRGIQALKEKMLKPYLRQQPACAAGVLAAVPRKNQKPSQIVMAASCESREQWSVLESMEKIREVYMSVSLYEALYTKGGIEYFQDLSERRQWMLALPHVARGRDLGRLELVCGQALAAGCGGFLVRNLESFAFLSHKGWAGKCHLDAGMYTYNDRAVDFWRGQGAGADMVPLELNQGEIAHRDNSMSYMTVYGYLPLMVSAQCVQKNTRQCDRKSRCLFIRDRYQKEFPVKCYCDFCYNIVYNSLPYGLPGYRDTLLKMGLSRFLLSFTLESGEETKKTAEAFLLAYEQGIVQEGVSFTRGHMKRGVE